MKTFLLAFVSMFALSCNALTDHVTPITLEQLPADAQKLVSTYFGSKKIAAVMKETDSFEREYRVVFNDGDKVEFNRKGEWKEINCRRSAVPDGIVPAQIRSYVSANYPGTKIIELDRDRKEYDVKLSNRLEITFNKNFQVVDIDD